jgi:MFS family permease
MQQPNAVNTNDAPWPSPVVAWYGVAILFIAYTFSFADRFILSLLIQPIKADLALSDTKVSLLHGLAFAIFYTFMGIPIGRLADKFSRRKIIAGGVAVWSLMTALCGVAQGYWQLFAARIGVGVGEGALSPAAYSMIADSFPQQKLGRALSVYTTGAFVGIGLAYIIGGKVIGAITVSPEITLPIVGTIRSWQAAFFIVGLPGLIVAALMFTVREPLRRINAAATADAGDLVPLATVLGFIWSRRQVYVPFFIGFAVLAVVSNGVFAWTPTFLNRSFAMALGESGPAIGVIVLTFGTGGLITGGWLTDRWSQQGLADSGLRAGIVAGLGGVPFAILLPFMTTQTSALATYCPVIFFATFGFGAAAAALQHVTPNRMRGLTSAIYLFFINLIGLGLGPTFVALITDYGFKDESAVGFSIAIVAAGSGLIAAILLWLGLKPFRAEAAKQQGK